MYSLKSCLAGGVVAIGCLTATAQQLPNPGFEGDWINCVPWNSSNTTTVQGSRPEGWCIANVVTPGMSAGNATIGQCVVGNDSEKAVKVTNKTTVGQVIPGYFTLGTSWATAEIKFSTPRNTDGGVWGGIEWSYQPDAIAFDYIRTQGKGSTQPATLSAYMWKGSTSQADVPANNSYSFLKFVDATKITMANRDRNILGMATTLGGEVTRSDDFALIARADASIQATEGEEFATMTVPFDYSSDATPEMINVTFGAMDLYADRSSHKGDDALTVDNVRMVYYSRLASLAVGDVTIDGFDPEVYSYASDEAYSRDLKLVPTVMGRTATCEISFNDTALSASIVVSNIDADADGNISHTYVVRFTDATSGIADAIADDDSEIPVRYYRLNGMEVEKPVVPGVYVVRRGSVASKIVVR